MHANPIAENVFGTIGAVLWSIQILPQLWKSYRSKDVEGLSGELMLVWAIASLFLGTYAIVENINIPIILQPQLFGTFSAFSWAQTLYYGPKKYSLKKCALFLGTFLAVFASFEGGMTVALRKGVERGVEWPVTMFGIISAVLLAGALLPQYWEIYKYKEVKGISLFFLAVDMIGGIACVISLAFKESLDPVATANYSGVVILDGIVMILAWILNPRANKRRAREALESGETVDASSTQEAQAAGLVDVEKGLGVSPHPEAEKAKDVDTPASTIVGAEDKEAALPEPIAESHIEDKREVIIQKQTDGEAVR